MQRMKYLYAAAGTGVMTLMGSSVAQAAFGLPTPSNTSLSNGVEAKTVLNNTAQTVINIIFLIAGILAVIYLLWSGVQYITAGGNADKVKAARQGIINAVIGIVIIMAAFFIIRLATSTRSEFDRAGSTGGGSGTGSGGF